MHWSPSDATGDREGDRRRSFGAEDEQECRRESKTRDLKTDPARANSGPAPPGCRTPYSCQWRPPPAAMMARQTRRDRFVNDTALEGSGFEPPVPLAGARVISGRRRDRGYQRSLERRLLVHGGPTVRTPFAPAASPLRPDFRPLSGATRWQAPLVGNADLRFGAAV